MATISRVFAVVFAVSASSFPTLTLASGTPNFAECVELGVKYYKEIGSYPKLSTGEDALQKVQAMCKRSPLAFGTGQ